MTPEVLQQVRSELATPIGADVRAVAASLARLGGQATVGVLYYGSSLRAGAPEGVLDFYVLLDDLRAWPGGRLRAIANAILPPNVEYREFTPGGRRVRAKVAIVSLRQFQVLVGGGRLDTTVWARFCQPAVLAWSRGGDATERVAESVAQAVVTAARWAALLGPERGRPQDFWDALFRQTYAAEFRVERAGREKSLLAFAGERYARLTGWAWRAAGIAFEEAGDGTLSPRIGAAHRRRGLRAWAMRRRAGKPLNVLRLLKAAFTFSGAARYAAYKVEKHTGIRLTVTPWQERHPLLASPAVLWRLWRDGAFR